MQGQLTHRQTRQEQLPVEQLQGRLHGRHVPVLPGARPVQQAALEEWHNCRHDPPVGVDRPVEIRRAREQDHEGHATPGQHQRLRISAGNHVPDVCRQVRKLDREGRDLPLLLQPGQSVDRLGTLRLHGVPCLHCGRHHNTQRLVLDSPRRAALLVLPLLPGKVPEIRRADQHGGERG